MAEILGTVSSAIAVAEFGVTVGSTLFKLRKLWEEVQDVPEKIQDLMRQIEIHEPLLAEVEQYLQADPLTGVVAGISGPFDTSARRKISVYCRKALTDLQDLVNELSKEISSAQRKKRGIAKLKVVLRKDDLKKFHSRLESAFDLLRSVLTVQQSAQNAQRVEAKLEHQSIQIERLM